MPKLEPVFHLFPKLPKELRQEIWRYCLPYRVSELDTPVGKIVYKRKNEGDPIVCTLSDTTYINGRPPVISRVCFESRSVAFETGSIPTGFAQGRPKDTQWTSGTTVANAWEDRLRDSAHLNWSPSYHAEYQSQGDAVKCLEWTVAHLSGTGSILSRYLTPGGISPDYWWDNWATRSVPASSLSLSKQSDLKALRRIPDLLVVILTLVVHCDLKSAATTGLFGLLGDAPVQIVEVSDEAKLNAYFDFGEGCERKGSVTISQDFRPGSEFLERACAYNVMDYFGCEELAAAARPAIMFRLCTQMCNHISDKHANDRSRAANGSKEGRKRKRGRRR